MRSSIVRDRLVAVAAGVALVVAAASTASAQVRYRYNSTPRVVYPSGTVRIFTESALAIYPSTTYRSYGNYPQYNQYPTYRQGYGVSGNGPYSSNSYGFSDGPYSTGYRGLNYATPSQQRGAVIGGAIGGQRVGNVGSVIGGAIGR